MGRRSSIHEGPALAGPGKLTLQTSTLDGEPVAILRMPEDSPWPLIVSLALLAAFYGLVTSIWGLALVGAILTLFGVHGWLWPRQYVAGS
jgi:hypothetical protein